MNISPISPVNVSTTKQSIGNLALAYGSQNLPQKIQTDAVDPVSATQKNEAAMKQPISKEQNPAKIDLTA
ncbi:MAG: hypothetical protein C4527_25815 [Candidatus Omnitrophota bacterium]|jgi:hypothetical protein|nr:MAG: hypothetical protein C4527_25815 [Candidatus Omnitrophota bacterium]